MLVSIDYIISAIIMVMTSIIFSNIVLENKKIVINKKKIIMLIIGIVVYSIIAKNTIGTLKTLLVFGFHIIQFNYLYKISYSDSMFLSFLFIVIIIIPDTLFLLFLMYILKLPPEICYEKIAGTIISTTVVNGLLIIITLIFRKWLRKIIKIRINNNLKIIIYTVLTLGCILIIFYNSFENVVLNSNLILSIILMVVFVVILYSLMKQKLENNKILEKYDKLLEFIKKYEKIIEEQRQIRHESKNQLITVKSKVLNKEDGEEIIKYVDSLLNDHKGYREDKYVMFQYLPSNGIKGLFYYKAMEAEEKEINLSIRISERVENSVLGELTTEDFKQLGRLVGVYLDNAIEASYSSEERKLGIEIYKYKEDVIIIISNTYSGEIDEESLGKVRYSTKGNNHGYGLMLVNKILSKSDKFIAEHKINDRLFTQKLIIKKSIN